MEANTTQARSLNPNTRLQYRAGIEAYKEVMTMIPGAPPPFPITFDSLRIFFAFRKGHEKVAFSTLQGNLAAIGHFIGENGLPDPTRTFEFKQFFNGLRRELKTRHPTQHKTPNFSRTSRCGNEEIGSNKQGFD